ncbi:hypothetical protein [Actinoplanes sp. NPDC051859]|uniref:hypothetical protein n=1 Tax=Actinoplanes sp. NPDC051859 TaxID=3363909 RepID=UPI0037AC5B67
MTALTVPELDGQPLTLIPEEPASRGSEQEADPELLAGRISLGGPLSVLLTEDGIGDADGKVFLKAEAGAYDYRLMHLSLTVTDAAEAPFETITLAVTLSSGGGPVVAWSMAPERIVDTAHLTRSYKLGPQLSIAGVDASLGGIEGSRSRESAEVLVEALRPLRADPAWLIRRGGQVPVRGLYRFAMVVRAPHGRQVETEIVVSAAVRQRRLFGYRLARPVVVPLG